jgi:hypothetical protein
MDCEAHFSSEKLDDWRWPNGYFPQDRKKGCKWNRKRIAHFSSLFWRITDGHSYAAVISQFSPPSITKTIFLVEILNYLTKKALKVYSKHKNVTTLDTSRT